MSLHESLRTNLDRIAPNYGAEGCVCGTHATPDGDCPLHWAIYALERIRGVLVEDGGDGEPTAEEALRRYLRSPCHDDDCLTQTRAMYAPCTCGLNASRTVLRRALESEA